jgi:DNA-binding transcriptional ArsR family regulator
MLEHFFGSKTRVKLLYLFFHEPDRPFYVRELARLITIQLNAVRRELLNLERFGIIRRAERGTNDPRDFSERSKYYQLDRAHVLYRELAAFLSKAQVLEQKTFIDHLLRVAGDVRFCLLTGFFMRVTSPTDVLIVGTLAVPAIEKSIAVFLSDPTFRRRSSN